MSPQQRRAAIIEAALAIMVEKGLASTTVRDVADRLGTSSGLIHHYFASMDELLAAAFERAAAGDLHDVQVAMTGAGGAGEVNGAVERLRIFFDAYTRADQDWAFQLWLDAWAEASRRPPVRDSSQRLNVAWQELIQETIVDGAATGVMVCADPAAAAWRILSLLDGLALQAVVHRVAIERDDVVAWAARYAEGELGLPAGSLQTRTST